MRTRRLAALCLCAALLVPCSGCRYSSVLEQMLYDMQRGQEIDEDADFHPEENDENNTETSDDLKDLQTDDEAQRQADETPELPQSDPDAEPASETASVETQYAPDGQETLEAAVGEIVPAETETATMTEALPAAADAEQTAPETPETVIEAAPEATTGGEAAETGNLGGAEAEGTSYDPNAAAQTWKQVVDAYGKTVDIPENVDKVTAVGELAVMVMMLDGADRLAAVNTGLSDDWTAAVFPALAEVPALWQGSGASPLSAENFAALLELQPDVVLEISGSTTVTDDQAAVLAEAGIAYLVVPAPTSMDNVRTVLTTLGTVLGDRSAEGGANAPQRAADYVAWAQALADDIAKATADHAAYTDVDTGESVSGTYTLYVDGWDDEAVYRLYNETYVTLSGTGCAVIQNGATAACKTLSSYLQVAHVVNTASQYGITPKALYFTPLISAYRTMEVTGPAADGMVTPGQKLLEQSDGSLGTSNFSILLAADHHTAQAIAESELWAVYPHINSGDGSFNSDGFLDEEGNLVRTQISGQYEIVVNPSGLSSWIGGSAESILESAWAAWRFYDAISETQLRNYIEEFYSRFYGYTLSQAEIDHILEGQ
jgi:ABC-type Fe3+-hydroxamate transport system substrate-binding protein